MGRRKDQAQFNMRLDRPLLKQLQNAARDQDRSVNSEMIHRLEQSFTRDSIQDRLTTIIGKIDQLLERRRDLLPMGPFDTLEARETDQERRVRLRADLEHVRKSAEALDARGAHDMAAQAREYADELERDAGAVTRHYRRSSVSDQEPVRQVGARSRLELSVEALREKTDPRMLPALSAELRKKADEDAALGRTDSAERLRRMADELLVPRQVQPRSVPNQEPELPMTPPRKSEGGKS